MSEVGFMGARTAMLGEDDRLHWMNVKDTRHANDDLFSPVYHNSAFDDYVAESWLPQPMPSWNTTTNDGWPHDSAASTYTLDHNYERQQQPMMLFTNFLGQYDPGHISPTPSADYEAGTVDSETCAYPKASLSGSDYTVYLAEEQERQQGSDSTPSRGMSSFQVNSTSFVDENPYGGQFMQEQHISTWSSTNDLSEAKSPYPISPSLSSPSGILNWPTPVHPSHIESSTQNYTAMVNANSAFSVSVPIRKRKAQGAKSGWAENTRKDLSDCVDVFENAPGALKAVKKRKKLDAPVRKAAREVRKAGACHQCKFRKRTCSTGTPCGSCLKNGGGLHEIKCQRESPFIGRSMHQYFRHSSTRRIVNLNLVLPASALSTAIKEQITIDGIGRISHPLILSGLRVPLNDFSTSLQKIIAETRDLKSGLETENQDILIFEDNEGLGTIIEQWAVEYTSKFVNAAGPKFYGTTIAHILGTAYVKKGLPEADLVAAMLRIASLSFILRAGVTSSSKTKFRTIPALIDTILYTRLALAQKDLCQKLQRLIFRSAGCLSRSQLYPVGLVLFQLLRFMCISSSHLGNISRRFRADVAVAAESQHHTLRLLISVHLALFRSSNPLLLDMEDSFNQDLLAGDGELIKLSGEMRGVVKGIKERGWPEMRGSITYEKMVFEEWRGCY